MVDIEKFNNSLSLIKQVLDSYRGTLQEHQAIQEAWKYLADVLKENESKLLGKNEEKKK